MGHPYQPCCPNPEPIPVVPIVAGISSGIILVLFILLVIILRTFPGFY
jgi:hypothetical protein